MLVVLTETYCNKVNILLSSFLLFLYRFLFLFWYIFFSLFSSYFLFSFNRFCYIVFSLVVFLLSYFSVFRGLLTQMHVRTKNSTTMHYLPRSVYSRGPSGNYTNRKLAAPTLPSITTLSQN